jgi:hypothetical protein
MSDQSPCTLYLIHKIQDLIQAEDGEVIKGRGTSTFLSRVPSAKGVYLVLAAEVGYGINFLYVACAGESQDRHWAFIWHLIESLLISVSWLGCRPLYQMDGRVHGG